MYGYPQDDGPVAFRYDPFSTTNPRRVKNPEPVFRTVKEYEEMKKAKQQEAGE